ncbi:MAG: HAD family hydrolase [Parcubacteria group bacterium]|jgi:FMN phosphatase YigB (HAD superfamily)
MKILVDFDDVLLNTNRFRKNYKKIYAAYGIDPEVFEQYYKKSVTYEKSITVYDPEKHLKEIKRGENIKISKLRKSIYNFAENSKKYVFKDVKKFLAKFKKDDIIIITHSKSKFQKVKLKNSGLKKLVKKIIQTGKLKAYTVKKLATQKIIKNGEAAYFLDDRVDQINEVKKINPSVITVLIRRREGRFQDKKTKFCDFEAKNLKEAYQIIKQKCQ